MTHAMRRSLSTTASLVVAVPPLPPGGPRSAGRARCGNTSRSSTRIGPRQLRGGVAHQQRRDHVALHDQLHPLGQLRRPLPSSLDGVEFAFGDPARPQRPGQQVAGWPPRPGWRRADRSAGRRTPAQRAAGRPRRSAGSSRRHGPAGYGRRRRRPVRPPRHCAAASRRPIRGARSGTPPTLAGAAARHVAGCR